MMLRSSSSPLLGSLLPSPSSCSTPHFHESPSHHHHHIEKAPSLSSPSFLHGRSQNQDNPGIRRALSEGNLHSLLSSNHPRASSILDSIPSFSVYPNKDDEDYGEEEEGEEEEFDEFEEAGIGGGIRGGLSVMGHEQNLNLVENYVGGGSGESAAPPLFLARGLGIDRLGSGFMNIGAGNGCGDGGNGGGGCDVSTGSGGERSDVENYYKRMVEEDPSNALFLGNYAQFLYQTKGDSQRAEEYYSRAILAEPGDGELLSQYAKLVWELHSDKERASCYFEQAVQATPTDSHVLAAYANFLWEAEDDDEVIGDEGQLHYFGSPVHQGISASATT